MVVPFPIPFAHGLVQRADLPLPEWLFAWAAVGVLVASFVGLAALWPQPRLEHRTAWRPLPGVGGVLGSKAVEFAAGTLGVLLLVLTLWAGFAGAEGPNDNFAPTFIVVIFWVGMAFASFLFGDVFRALSPWRASMRAALWLVGRVRGRPVEHRPYPDRLGRWPAAAGILGFTWIELTSGWPDDPQQLALCAAGYSVITWVAMAVYGPDRWHERGEGFGVYFGLLSRISVFERRDGVVGVRRPLSALTELQVVPGTVAVVVVMIGTVTYDGFSQGAIWNDLGPSITDFWTSLGIGGDTAVTLSGTVGLLACVGLIGGFYALGAWGAESVGGGYDGARLRAAFVHTLIPIALVYVVAHYLTYFAFQGQALGYLISDPLGRGWDLFGTAAWAIDYGVISQTATWYVQITFVVLGHIAGLILAHDRALVLYDDTRLAVRSQYWMLTVMVGFTSLALWLLAQANA